MNTLLRWMLWTAACVFLTSCGSGTDYTRADLGHGFSLLKTNDSLDRVFSVVGAPFFVEINRDRANFGAYRKERSTVVDLTSLQAITKDTNVALYLFYSRPRSRGGYYYRYEIDIVGGKVQKLRDIELVD
jgi:hypothetical protein